MSQIPIERAANKPREIRMSRFGLYRMIPKFDIVPGQAMLRPGEKADRTYLDFDAEGCVKRFDFYSRDGDLDGAVQDGSPWERRSRTLTHLRIVRGGPRKRRTSQQRLRDLPFPFTPPEPTKVDALTVAELNARVRTHNAAMRAKGAREWAMASLATVREVYGRAAAIDESAALRRVDAYLHLLAHDRPKDASYIADIDLLSVHHPWRSDGLQQLFAKSVDASACAAERFGAAHALLAKTWSERGASPIT